MHIRQDVLILGLISNPLTKKEITMKAIRRFVLAVSLVALVLSLSSCVYPAYDGYYTESGYYRPTVVVESDYHSRRPYLYSSYAGRPYYGSRYYRASYGPYYRPYYGPAYSYYRY